MSNRLLGSCATLILVTTLAACASGGGAKGDEAESEGRRADCGLRLQDSVFLARGAVYRDCAVDRKAQVVAEVRMDFVPPRPACYSATFEFIVDTLGTVDIGTARVERTNDNEYAESLKRTLPRLRFTPAVRDGVPVQQIVSFGKMLSGIVVRVPAGSPPPPRGTLPPAPKC